MYLNAAINSSLLETKTASEAGNVPQYITPSLSTMSARISQYTFPQIIDADHFTIERLAAKIRNPLTPNSTRQTLLKEVAWRLVRHDFSEEMVMRPAFIQVMGSKGVEMAEHDRKDHARAKNLIAPLLSLNFNNPEDAKVAMATLAEVFDELGEHMAIESGQMIPDFEKQIHPDLSRELAVKYAFTLAITPEVLLPATGGRQSRRKAFLNGVKEYIYCDMSVCQAAFKELMKEAERDAKYLNRVVDEQLNLLRVGKWISLNERKALQDSGTDIRSMKGKL